MPSEALLEQARKANENRAAQAAKRREEIDTRRLTNQIKLAELCEQNDWVVGQDVAVIYTLAGDMVVVKKPGPAVYQAFSQRALQQKVQNADCWALVKPNVVYPDAAEFLGLTNSSPGLVLKAADLCGDLAAPDDKETEGK